MRLLRKKNSILNTEHRLYRRDGRMIWLLVQLRALRDDGRLIGMDGIAWDITEKKALQEESVRQARLASIGKLFSDRGTGIASDLLGRVCEPFFTTKPPNRGTGLGLSISHGIIHDHQGKLWLESVQGEYKTGKFP